jgi:hypothetical protein
MAHGSKQPRESDLADERHAYFGVTLIEHVGQTDFVGLGKYIVFGDRDSLEKIIFRAVCGNGALVPARSEAGRGRRLVQVQGYP